MTDPTPKPLALELAERIDPFARTHAPDHLTMGAAAKELRRQHQAIVELGKFFDRNASIVGEVAEFSFGTHSEAIRALNAARASLIQEP
jgi:hypothetical protein